MNPGGMYEIRFPSFPESVGCLVRSFLGQPVPGDTLSGFKKAYGP